MLKYLVLILTTFVISCGNNPDAVPTIPDAWIEVDGLFDEEDWNSAQLIKLTSSNNLYLFQNNDYLFLGIKNNESVGRYVDLYLENDSIGIVNLHASMALGERKLIGNWNDTIPSWNWGNNTNWKANIVETVSQEDNISFLESVKPYQGHEFRISKKKIADTCVRIRIEIKDFMGEARDIVFPINSERTDTQNWLLIYF